MAFTPGQVLTADQMNALEGATVPTGGITMYGAGSAPTGWLLCDGTAVSRTTYAALFAVISTTYGVGNGTTTFNLPNLKGRVPVGKDSADSAFDVLGETGGAKTHTLTTSEMPSHTHTGPSHTHSETSHTHSIAHTHTNEIRNAVGLSFSNGTTNLYDYGGTATAAAYGTSTATTSQSTETSGFGSGGTTGSGGTGATGSAGSGSAHNNLQPYIVLNFIIKT